MDTTQLCDLYVSQLSLDGYHMRRQDMLIPSMSTIVVTKGFRKVVITFSMNSFFVHARNGECVRMPQRFSYADADGVSKLRQYIIENIE